MDVPTGVTQEEGHTGFLHLPSAVLALIFLARGVKILLPSLISLWTSSPVVDKNLYAGLRDVHNKIL